MKHTLLSSVVLGSALALAALIAPGIAAAAGPIDPGPNPACTAVGTAVTCNLWAKIGTIPLPGSSVTIWGFSATSSGSPSVPGPVLIVNQGDSVSVNLTNSLPRPTSIMFGGQAMVSDTTGAPAGGGTKVYTFTAGAPGTYPYEAGLIPGSQYQAAMGLYGALVVRPTGAPFQANGNPATTFADESLVILGEIDPALNGSATPWTYDLRGFAPKWFLVNGAPYSPSAPPITTTGGNSLLLRYVNAGIQHHSMGVLGLHQRVVAADGSALPFPRTMVAETLAPGQSADVLVSIPVTAATSTKYPIYDASMLMNNSTANGIGGMTALLSAAGAPAGDTVGPITSGIALTAAGSGTYTLTAVTDETTTGGANIAAAEYRVDSTTATAVAMSAADLAFDEVTEPVTTFPSVIDATGWTSGAHTVYVRGRDLLNNWGPFASTTITLDTSGPTVSGLTLTLASPGGIALAGTASDVATGNSNVVDAEYFIDATGTNGTGAAMAVNHQAPIASITATIPDGTTGVVYVHALDAAGNWGTYAQITLGDDSTGPATTVVGPGLGASPNPTNGRIGVNSSTQAVRITASFSDAGLGDGQIAAGEGFIDTPGSNGGGFQFVASDGIFNAVTETGLADIPLTTITLLSDGPHAILVHGKDAAGNWGTLVSLTLTVDKTGPVLTSITASPSPTNTTTIPYTSGTSFGLSATATDATTSVTAGEWWEGADPGAGNGTQFSGVSTTIDYVARDWAAGNHTLNARVRDAAGNWSTVSSTIVAVVLPDNVFADSFGSGGTSAWTSVTDTTSALSVTAGASLNGSPALGMQTTLGGTAGRYVTNATPRLDASYHARFYFNPNGALLANSGVANSTTILSGLNAANNVIFQVQVRRQNAGGGTYQVRLVVARAGGTTATSYYTITNASHYIGVAWQSAASASASLVTDGTVRRTLTNLNTSANLLDAVRLGPSAGLSNAATGTLHFDGFASTRRTATDLLP
ncbi:MAG: multicopper oxidase domain-containing protein [Candidatus Limnocylindrales bacterium]